MEIENNFDVKNPIEMSNIALLEIYNHYSKLSFRLKDEQDYLGLLRREILERMSAHQNSRNANERSKSS